MANWLGRKCKYYKNGGIFDSCGKCKLDNSRRKRDFYRCKCPKHKPRFIVALWDFIKEYFNI